MTNTPTKATPRSVRDTLWEAYKETTDFEGSLYSALFAALTMLEKMEARIAALEAARPIDVPKVLYEGEADVMGYGIYVSTHEPLCGRRRVHVVVTAAEDDES